MEREELENLVSEELGSTQLTLSEETLNGEYDDILEDFSDDMDEESQAKLVTKFANRLKRMDGQLHKNVADEVKKYKANQKKTPKKKTVKDDEVDDDAPAWFKAYKAEQDKKWEEQEASRKAEQLKAEKKSVLDSIDKAVKASFKKADITLNTYIYKQTLRDIEIPDEGADVDKLAKQLEKDYNKNLKEAGLDGGRGVGPRRKNQSGGNGAKDAMNAYFDKKKKEWEKAKGKKS